MHRISGASRHCPLLVIELARDMSSEPNTETKTIIPTMSQCNHAVIFTTSDNIYRCQQGSWAILSIGQQQTHTQTTILQLYGFYLDNPGEPVPEETFPHSHLSWSSIVPYLLLQSNMIHGMVNSMEM